MSDYHDSGWDDHDGDTSDFLYTSLFNQAAKIWKAAKPTREKQLAQRILKVGRAKGCECCLAKDREAVSAADRSKPNEYEYWGRALACAMILVGWPLAHIVLLAVGFGIIYEIGYAIWII